MFASCVVLTALVNVPAYGALFSVNVTTDAQDAFVDGVCDLDGPGPLTECSLRGAITEARRNGLTSDTITLPVERERRVTP